MSIKTIRFARNLPVKKNTKDGDFYDKINYTFMYGVAAIFLAN